MTGYKMVWKPRGVNSARPRGCEQCAREPALRAAGHRLMHRFSPGMQAPLYPAKSFGIMALLGVAGSYPQRRGSSSTMTMMEFFRHPKTEGRGLRTE